MTTAGLLAQRPSIFEKPPRRRFYCCSSRAARGCPPCRSARRWCRRRRPKISPTRSTPRAATTLFAVETAGQLAPRFLRDAASGPQGEVRPTARAPAGAEPGPSPCPSAGPRAIAGSAADHAERFGRPFRPAAPTPAECCSAETTARRSSRCHGAAADRPTAAFASLMDNAGSGRAEEHLALRQVPEHLGLLGRAVRALARVNFTSTSRPAASPWPPGPAAATASA